MIVYDAVEQVFTFHYASTLSRQAGTYHIDLDDLHSTMLLLYPFANLANY